MNNKLVKTLLSITLTTSIMCSNAMATTIHMKNYDMDMFVQSGIQMPEVYTSGHYLSSDDKYVFPWKLINQKSKIIVAVLDTGVDYNNKYLKGKIDLSNCYNFIDNNTDVMDHQGHGTEISGIIASDSSLGFGETGITGDLDVKVMPIKVMDDKGYGNMGTLSKGIIWAVDHGANVINLSLCGEAYDKSVDEAITYADKMSVPIVVAAGNYGKDMSKYYPNGNSKVITVSAVNSDNDAAKYSSYGDGVDISAIGDNIETTIMVDKKNQNHTIDITSGTSMAAAEVTGIIALLKAENPNVKSSDIKLILEKSSIDLGDKGKDIHYGYGLVDPIAAIQAVKELSK